MKWNKFTLKTLTEAEDIVISALISLGIEGVEIEDKVPLTEEEKRQMFVDIPMDASSNDNIAYVNFYLEEGEDRENLLKRVREELEELRKFTNIGEGSLLVSETEDIDWINNWKEHFKQFSIDDILIVPSWEEAEKGGEEKMVIHMDPGMAFGTGMHETTQLCIRQLRKYVKKEAMVLDVGCGSGILSLMALKFGAGHTVGTDLDDCAKSATYENMEVNGITKENFEVLIGNIIDQKEIQDKVGYRKYDIVVANILAEILICLTPVIRNQLKPGGIYITSGIIDEREKIVLKCLKEEGFTILEVKTQGEWVSVTAKAPLE
ncbi:50S ribosomal protein L11 methyltransferase [bacterium 1XD42-8]|jgi:ribosomal protein L11 methyltransferase|nr:50S ribosomal protein L11 methyltransferase [Lachnospiraceae bacterium]RKJ48326.1 50S ribosomal protein L11 methyltransferase [bacterium 1XD42-8]